MMIRFELLWPKSQQWLRPQFFLISQAESCLEGEQDEEGNHQTEQTHGLGQGETQNGVAVNKLEKT